MLKVFISLCCVAALSGCASGVDKVDVKEVKVPVAVCPVPPEVEDYNLVLDSLPANADYNAIAKAVRIDLYTLVQRDKMLMSILNEYRKAEK